MKDSKDQIARCLNMSDRVTILHELVHNEDDDMDDQKLNSLLDQFYPSFTAFCVEASTLSAVTGLTFEVDEGSITFTALSDGATTSMSYTEMEAILP